ncbi:hypothetical protein AP073_15250 [Rhodobacter capsulatus]|nr:hypothetical protein AP073_15250 [Rhodobacter capsulatus]
MGIVDETIQDGVGEGGISASLVPVIDGELACDDGGAAAMAILEAGRLEGGAGAALFVQRACHSGQAERGEALGSGVGQHPSSPLQW